MGAICCGSKGDDGTSVANLKGAKISEKEDSGLAPLVEEQKRLTVADSNDVTTRDDVNRPIEEGDDVFFKGQSNPLPDGGEVKYGMQGRVAWIKDENGSKRCGLQFPGIKYTIDCKFEDVSREKPSDVLTGGWKIGDKAFYVGITSEFGGGVALNYGDEGAIVGSSNLGDADDAKKVAVKFPQVPQSIAVELASLSQIPPAEEFAGGFRVRDVVWYKGPPMKFPTDGDPHVLEEGMSGEVLAPHPTQEGWVLLKVAGFPQFVTVEGSHISKDQP